MTTQQSNLRTIRFTIIGLLLVILCGSTAIGGFYFGRRSANNHNEPTAVAGVTTTSTAQTVDPTDTTTPAVVSQEATTMVGSDEAQEQPATSTSTNTAGSTAAVQSDVQIDHQLIDEVMTLVGQNYDGDVPADDIVTYGAVQGALATLDDPYTTFLTPEVAARVREQAEGSFEGIGAYVELNEEGFLEIVRPIDDQPAAQAGLLPGDLIIAVDGESVVGKTVDEAITLVRGPRGTSVTLSIAREGLDEPFDVTIVRQLIEIPVIEARMLDNNIAYVHLTTFFNRTTTEQLSQAIDGLLAQEPRALIFDLRDNGGGFLDQAISVADLFMPGGVVLFERNRQGLDQTFSADSGEMAEAIPLVVLVNAGSASASEIVAGAIQDNGRAILIGETTFGKGSVQQTYTLPGGSELRVTVARWYTPNDNTIDQEGIAPDIEVLPSPIDLGGPEDTQLQRAIEYILNGQ
jgi:carboxyl-terminal processing protease